MKLPKLSFGQQAFAGLALGVILGLAARAIGPVADGSPNWLSSSLDTIGSLFVGLLKAIVVPLVFTAIVASIARLREVTNAARLAAQTILWFAITALIAVSIGIVIALALRPGAHSGISPDLAGPPSHEGSWWAFLTGLFPTNFLGLGARTSIAPGASGSTSATTAVTFNVLQLVVVAVAFGIAALKVGRKAEPFVTLNASALAIVTKVLWWIIRLLPIATVGLLGHAIGTYGLDTLRPLAFFMGAMFLGLALVLFGVYPALLRLHGLRPGKFYAGIWPATQLALVSRSTLATMPVNEQLVETRLGVPREYAAFAVPLASTTKYDGCGAVYPAVASIFIAQFYGIHLSVADYFLIVVVSVIGSLATASTTGATVMLTLTLTTLGLPLAGVGLIAGIDPVLDMARTAINVTGQALVPTIVARRAGILDEAVYNAARAPELVAPDLDADDDLRPGVPVPEPASG